MRKFQTVLLVGFIAYPLWIKAVSGAEPTAVVEDYSGHSDAIKTMQILFLGQKLNLNQGEELVLGYFKSCLRETITGGSVTIGQNKSNIRGGKVLTETVDCDGGSIVGPESSRKEVAAAVIRDLDNQSKLPKADRVSFGTSPILFSVKRGATIKIERLDKMEKAVEFISDSHIVDTRKWGVHLEPSGIYKIRVSNNELHLMVSPFARTHAPIISRIIVLKNFSKK